MSNNLSKKRKSIVTLFTTACLAVVLGVGAVALPDGKIATASSPVSFVTEASSFNNISHWNGSAQAEYVIAETNGVNMVFDSTTKEFMYEDVPVSSFTSTTKAINFYVNMLGNRFVRMYVDLIDSTDSSNYVSVRVNSKDGGNIYDSSLAAAVPSIGQQYTGCFFNDTTQVRVNSTNGSRKYSNITVSNATNTVAYAPIHFSYDDTSKKIQYTLVDRSYTADPVYLVTDLDDTTTTVNRFVHDGTMNNTKIESESGSKAGYYDTAWTGFKGDTVDVRIRVEGTDISATEPVALYITSIGGAAVDPAKCSIVLPETSRFGTVEEPISHWDGSKQADYVITETGGVNFSFDRNGKEFYYKKQVDLTKIDGSKKFINFYVKPLGDRNVRIYVDLIDSADEDNYVSVKINSKDGSSTHDSSFAAAVPSIGQQYTGAFINSATSVRVNSTSGSRKYSNITVSDTNNKTSYAPIHFSYDNDSKKIQYTTYDNAYSGTRYLVTDLDDTTMDVHYYLHDGTMYNNKVEDGKRAGYYDTAWTGFKSDFVNVRIRVEGDDFSAKPVDIYVTEIGGLAVDGKQAVSRETITYELNGGTNSDKNPKYVDGTDTILYDAEKSGYGFEGWYNSPVFEQKNKVTKLDASMTSAMTLYANFVEVEERYLAKPSTFNEIAHSGGTYSITKTNGLNLVFDGANTEYTYSKPIAVAQFDGLQAFIDFYVKPLGDRNVSIYVDLIDAANAENYLSVKFGSKYGATHDSYVLAAVPAIGQAYVGKVVGGDGLQGTRKYSNITLSDANNATEYAALHFGYDNATKQILVTAGDTPYTGERNLVADLDSAEHFNTVWSGFGAETVFVRIRVEGDLSAAQPVELYVTEIGGEKINALYCDIADGITYELNGGENDARNPKNYRKADGFTLYPATKTGFVFAGWYTTADFQAESRITEIGGQNGALTLYAKFAEGAEIEYHLNGGANSAKNPAQYCVGEQTLLYPATKSGYAFKGWYTTEDFTEYTDITSITSFTVGKVTLYAKFSKISAVTYALADGTNDGRNLSEYVEGDGLTLYPASKDGYIFEGWYTTSNFAPESKTTEISATATGDIALYAKFADAGTVTYVLNGGANHADNAAQYAVGTGFVLRDAFKADCAFVGWYTTADFAEDSKVTEISATATGDITLYARFQAKSTITYIVGVDASYGNNPLTYVEGETFTLADATKEGYTFAGWYTTEEYTPESKVTEITADCKGDLILFAKFVEANGSGQENGCSNVISSSMAAISSLLACATVYAATRKRKNNK